jgi:hypothetical protein
MAKKKNNRLDKLNALLDNLDTPEDNVVVSPPKAVIEDDDVPPPALAPKNGKLGPTRSKQCGHFSWWNTKGKCGHYECRHPAKKD